MHRRGVARSRLGRLLRLLAPLLLASLAFAGSGRAQGTASAASAAERCIACGGATAGRHIVYRGRTVGVCSPACEAHWDLEREELFAGQQARGALFDEAATKASDERSLLSGWFWFGSYVVVGLLCGAWAAYLALSKGLTPLPWLLAGLAFNVVAVARVAMLPRGDLSQVPGGMPGGLGKIPLTHAPVACAACGGVNHPNARACVGCGARLKSSESESMRGLGRSPS